PPREPTPKAVCKTWAQSGHKTPAFGAQIEGWLVSKGGRINVNLSVVSRWRSARASVKACGPCSKNSCFSNPNLGESRSLILLNFAVPRTGSRSPGDGLAHI